VAVTQRSGRHSSTAMAHLTFWLGEIRDEAKRPTLRVAFGYGADQRGRPDGGLGNYRVLVSCLRSRVLAAAASAVSSWTPRLSPRSATNAATAMMMAMA